MKRSLVFTHGERKSARRGDGRRRHGGVRRRVGVGWGRGGKKQRQRTIIQEGGGRGVFVNGPIPAGTSLVGTL